MNVLHTRQTRRKFSGLSRAAASLLLVAGWAGLAPAARAQEFYPVADGTLADGLNGPFDGEPDAWDWTFNGSSYEGALALVFDDLDRRVVWEYNLSGASYQPPVSALLTFTMRGVSAWPPATADVHIYSYPADLAESTDDFMSGPTVLEGSVGIPTNQPPTVYTLDVSTVVNEALSSGEDAVAFRFQINPWSSENNTQAFFDAEDADPTTKPYVTISEAPLLGDMDCDGEFGMADIEPFVIALIDPDRYADQFPGCNLGAADLNGDGSVDGLDIAAFVQLLLTR